MNPFFKLGFIGSYKVDFLHYLARILQNLNKKVILVDASQEQYLKYTLPEMETKDFFTYEGIDCLIGKNNLTQLEEIDFTEYDLALIDYGFNTELQDHYGECFILFLVTDFEKHNIYRVKNIIQALGDGTNVVKIFRDIIDSKINRKYINYLLNSEENLKVLAEYSFEFKEEDYKSKLLCQYDDRFTFKYLSKEYKKMYADIIEELYGFKLSEIMKAIKNYKGDQLCK